MSLLLICPPAVPVCQAATPVRTLNGTVYTGKVDLDNNGVTITPEQGAPVKVELSNVWSAALNQPAGLLVDSWPQGVFLRNGTFVASQAKLSPQGVAVGSGTNAIPAANIAWVLAGPIKYDKFPHPPKGRAGVVLPTGDFFEGIYNGINEEHRIMINSWMFGPHVFSLNAREIAAAVIHDIPEAESLTEIVMSNGSRYYADGEHGRELRYSAGLHDFLREHRDPKDALPDTRLTFAVYADGRFLLTRSPIIAFGEKPQPLHVDLGKNARTFVIRAEPAAPGSGKSAGRWIAPMFVRP